MLQRTWLLPVILGFAANNLGIAENGHGPQSVVATVGDQPVFASEVEAELRQAYGQRPFVDEEGKRLFKAGLDQVIDRRLVLSFLAKNGQAASQQDVDLALAQFEKELKSQNLTLAEHAKKVGLSVDEIRRSLAWKISWKRYCDKYLTPENLEKYFERYRREFDGTQIRVAQILFKLPMDANDAAIEAAKERASKLREEIVGGKTSFADAAKKHSDAPSKAASGDIGWIERHQPMPEEYAKVAFSVKKGEVSQPLVTSFGVHLLTVLDEKPGTRTWRDGENELRPAVTLYLFRWIADKERANAKIEYLMN